MKSEHDDLPLHKEKPDLLKQLKDLSPEELKLIAQRKRREQKPLSLHDGAGTSQWSPIVAIRRKGSKKALFLADPAGGSAKGYYELAEWLHPEQPLYGFQRYRLGNTETCFYSSIEELAATYIDALKQIQTEGPYFIGGYSMGGIVGFEMASQLQRAGHEVALIIMIDSPAYPAVKEPQPKFSILENLQFIVTALAADDGRKVTLPWSQIEKLIPEEQVRWFAAEMWKQKLTPAYIEESSWQALLATLENSYELMRGYTPKYYNGRIAVLRAALPPSELQGLALQGYKEPGFGWQRFTPYPVKVEYLESSHMELMAAPHIRSVASVLQRWLDQIVVNNGNWPE